MAGETVLVEIPSAANFVVSTFIMVEMAEDGVEGMVRCIEYLEPAKDGDANARFFWYDGRSLAW